MEKINWVFCNVAWLDTYPQTVMHLDLKYKSDHRVLVISTSNEAGVMTTQSTRGKRFHFQAAWLLEEGFSTVVKEAWKDREWKEGVETFTREVHKWNLEQVGNIPKKKKLIMRRLEGIDRSTKQGGTNGLYRLEKKLWEEYNRLMLQEELLWFQKSRCNWLQ